MIIKGNPAGSVGFWSSHLLRDDTNERAEVKEITGLTADDLPGALREMQAVASGSKSQGNFMYQANINPRDDERLTPEQWREAVDTLEKNLGLEGHQRVVVEHVKEGRQHYHVVWNRVDVDTMKVADMGGNYPTHERTARELEARFDHTPTPTPAPSERKPGMELWEQRAAERSGIDPAAMKTELTTLWKSCDNGQAFAAALDEHGYVLARGDRRDFCVIDAAGDAHSLARRLDGVKAAEVRAFMADVDRDALPSVAEGRAEQRALPKSFERSDVGFDEPTVEVAPSEPAPAGPEWNPYIADGPDLPSIAPAEHAALTVMDAVTGAVEKLGECLADFFTDAPAGDPAPSQAAQIVAQRRAAAALENIRDSINEGRAIDRDDLVSLTPTHLRDIKEKGDEYLRQLASRAEIDRDLDRSWSRERER